MRGRLPCVNVPSITTDRLLRRVFALGAVGALKGGGCARLAFTEQDRRGRDLVIQWMKEQGLTVTVDQIGNAIGVRPGLEEGAPVMTGSHIDTVGTSGPYDGALGVLAGLEVIETLNDHGIQTRRPLAVAFFSNEEGARFAPDMMGSLVYQGGLSLADALATVGIDGVTVGDALRAIGYAGPAPVGRPNVHAFVELHIEQGPMLEHLEFTIGAVTGVQGIAWTEYVFSGVSNHAGTAPMSMRHDAGYAAGALTHFVRLMAEDMGGDQKATVGSIQLVPGLINVVAKKATVTVDLRNTDQDRLDEAIRRTDEFVRTLAAREGLGVERQELVRFEPVAFDEAMVSAVERIANDLGHPVMRLGSGAGHDAQMLARGCSAGMIFVPSVGGISHNIEEFTEASDIEAGANVLCRLMVELAS